MTDGFIRLISGQWKGKKLPVKDKQGLRPTTDRTKETLFNWLMHDIRDCQSATNKPKHIKNRQCTNHSNRFITVFDASSDNKI